MEVGFGIHHEHEQDYVKYPTCYHCFLLMETTAGEQTLAKCLGHQGQQFLNTTLFFIIPLKLFMKSSACSFRT